MRPCEWASEATSIILWRRKQENERSYFININGQQAARIGTLDLRYYTLSTNASYKIKPPQSSSLSSACISHSLPLSMHGSSSSLSSSSRTSPYALRTLVSKSTSSGTTWLAIVTAGEGLDEIQFWQSKHVQPGPCCLPLRTQPHLLFMQAFFLQAQPLRSCTWPLTRCTFVHESHSISKLSPAVFHPYSVTSSRWYSLCCLTPHVCYPTRPQPVSPECWRHFIFIVYPVPNNVPDILKPGLVVQTRWSFLKGEGIHEGSGGFMRKGR